MRKDEIKSSDYCPECVDEEGVAEPDANDTECCSCCCSCSDCGSESGSNNVSIGAERNSLAESLAQRKKELLSNLTILKTNQEKESIQHLLQFIEALSYSPDFVRRYNMQDNFCLECLLSEPGCTCCISGLTQMNLNDESCDSCDECNRDESSHRQRCPPQGCSDCTAMQKPPSSERRRNENRRERRRRRRRERNVMHNLPRVSVANFSHRDGNSSTYFTRQHPSERNARARNNVSLPRISQNTASHSNDTCDECCNGATFRRRRNNSESRRHSDRSNDEVSHNSDSCDECCKEEICRRGNNPDLRRSSNSSRDSRDEDSDSCKECSKSNSLSTPCTMPQCNECENVNKRTEILRRNSLDEENRSCTCCIDPSKQPDFAKCSNDKKDDTHKTGKNQDAAYNECPDYRQRQTTLNCTCEECQENSDCSEDSCFECKNSKSREKKGKK